MGSVTSGVKGADIPQSFCFQMRNLTKITKVAQYYLYQLKYAQGSHPRNASAPKPRQCAAAATVLIFQKPGKTAVLLVLPPMAPLMLGQ